MRATYPVLMLLSLALVTPVVFANPGQDGTFPSQSDFGRCTAYQHHAHGNQSSGGVVDSQLPFATLNSTYCDNVSAPNNGTPGAGHGNGP